LFGHGNAGQIPVRAVSDGLLVRHSDWFDAVAMLHADPLHPNVRIWTYYSGMAAANGIDSYVNPDFPLGSESVPVKAGQIIGYEGTWNGKPQWPKWIHVHFAVVKAEGDSFPDSFTSATLLDPTGYLGLMPEGTNSTLQSLRCKQP
jgi:hypothetical protein